MRAVLSSCDLAVTVGSAIFSLDWPALSPAEIVSVTGNRIQHIRISIRL